MYVFIYTCNYVYSLTTFESCWNAITPPQTPSNTGRLIGGHVIAFNVQAHMLTNIHTHALTQTLPAFVRGQNMEEKERVLLAIFFLYFFLLQISIVCVMLCTRQRHNKAENREAISVVKTK